MSGYRDKLKSFKPGEAGSALKGQKGLVGRGDKHSERNDHVAAPLSSLRDPASFGPPPKHVNPGGPVSVPPPVSRTNQSPSSATAALPAPAQSGQQWQDEDGENPPPRPYRVDTSGLSTAHLPPPPFRRDGADGRAPAPAAPPAYSAIASPKPRPPSLPPRLPPRALAAVPPPSLPSRSSTVESLPRAGLVNQEAVNRLGAAGISVPALGIGKNPAQNPMRTTSGNEQMNGLQSRFEKLGTASPSLETPPSEGTTFAQKQAAFKTITSFRQDPSSVSLRDAKAAASTANNFRQRHGDQVAAGLQSAKNVNERYGVMQKVGGYADASESKADHGPNSDGSMATTAVGLFAKKKPPPPPPPKKKPALAGGHAGDAPPPIPLSSKPRF